MKWLILVLLAAVTSSRAYAKDDPFVCVPGNNASKGVFTFEIWRALTIDQDTTLFRLCELSSKSFLMVKAKEGGKFKIRTVNLDAEQLATLKSLYQATFAANFKDDTFGTDGSTWCLEANRMNYLKVCFWTPSYNAQRRGIAEFEALGKALWDLAQFDGSNGELR